ncbi:MAG: hypothetical protein ACOH1L_07400 [Thermomonas sp.]
MIAMVALLLAAQTVITPATPFEFSDALDRADTHEAALDPTIKATLVRAQNTALKASMASCVNLAPGKLPHFTVVLELDSSGHSLNSWRNNNVPMVRCVERELAKATYPTNRDPDFFMSFVVTFEP